MFKYEWIWAKDNGTGFLNANYAPMKIHENILIFSDGAASPSKNAVKIRYNPQFVKGTAYVTKNKNVGSNYSYAKPYTTINEGTRYPTDIIYFQRDADAFHPTQKPVDLIRYLIKTYTDEGETVLDNCMGSGTTAIACIKEKRHFIGFELNEEYYNKAVKRINNERAQLTLF